MPQIKTVCIRIHACVECPYYSKEDNSCKIKYRWISDNRFVPDWCPLEEEDEHSNNAI